MDAHIETHENRMNMDRLFARAFVILGGAFWAITAFAGLYSFVRAGASVALLAAFYVFAATAATLAIGWFFERSAAALLVLGSIAVVAWGVIANWELGVWILMGIFLIGPMLTSAVLFLMARREQEVVEHATAFGHAASLATVDNRTPNI